MTEKIEDLQTNEELADIRKTGWKIFIFFAIVTAAIYYNNNMRGCLEDQFCVAGGKDWKLANTGFHESINGLSMVTAATAHMMLPNGEERMIPVKSYGDDNWGDRIDTSSWSVKGISVTDIEDPITIRLAFSIPDMGSEDGTKVTILAKGRVTIPKIVGGTDNVVDRSLGTAFSFEDKNEPFEYEKELIVNPNDWEKHSRVPGWIFWVCLAFSVLAFLAVLGSKGHSEEEDRRIKALKASMNDGE